MAATSSAAIAQADFDVSVNGSPLSSTNLDYVMEIVVDQSVALPSMFTLLLASSDAQSQPPAWTNDSSVFAVGDAIEVKLGYYNNLTSMIQGEVTSVEAEFSAASLPLLRVRGYDRRHRLQRGRKTRSFLKQSDSDIASSIGSDAGLTTNATATGTFHDYVLQANQTDWEFLCERASRIRYELFVTGKTLYFRPAANDEGAVLTIDMQNDDDLLEFHPRLSSVAQPTEVTLQSWSIKDKDTITSNSASADIVSTMGGSQAGADAVQSAFSDAPQVLTAYPVAAQAEADAIAKARINQAALQYITGEGTCFGKPDIVAGKVITITGIGSRFSGQYYVTSAIHRVTPARGYRTEFSVRRTAS